MIFLTTYHTMSFHDDMSKTEHDAFYEGVAYAEKTMIRSGYHARIESSKRGLSRH